MTPVTRAGAALVIAALIAITSSWVSWLHASASLEKEVERLEARFENLRQEHQRAMAAADEALKARDEINTLFRTRSRSLEAALAGNAGFALVPVPDDLRLLFTTDADAANAPAGPDGDSGQEQH